LTHANTSNNIADDVPSAAMKVDQPGQRASAVSEERFELIRTVLESSTEYSIIATDSEGLISLWNEGAQRLYGYEPSEIIGKPKALLHSEEDVLSGLPQKMMDGARKDGKWTGWVTRVRKDGSEFTARVALTPRRGPRAELVGFLLMSSDVTDEVRLTAELESSQRDLREANVQLEAASQAKDRFLASMSHELRTPLNAILGFTGTILMELPGPLNDEQSKQLRTVQSSGRHLLSLINDMLDLAKIESGGSEPSVEPIDCQELLEEVAVGLRPLAEEKQLALEVIAPTDRVEVHTDQRALRQILINLVNNAIKFTDEGEVRLQLDRHNGHGSLQTRFTVTDTGPGIKAADQGRLFAAFEQLDNSTRRASEGTGLGLYICRTLATFIGAAITFESEYGKGSAFTLELPE
jgi:PAS domain S-box-containing protein